MAGNLAQMVWHIVWALVCSFSSFFSCTNIYVYIGFYLSLQQGLKRWQRPTNAYSGQHRPIASQWWLMNANAGQPRPTAPNSGPTKTNEGLQHPMQATEMTDRATGPRYVFFCSCLFILLTITSLNRFIYCYNTSQTHPFITTVDAGQQGPIAADAAKKGQQGPTQGIDVIRYCNKIIKCCIKQ